MSREPSCAQKGPLAGGSADAGGRTEHQHSIRLVAESNGFDARARQLREAAMAYAEQGLRVIPLHSIRSGQCSCGKTDCQSPGKHPRLKHGLTEASSDLATVERWWRKWPDANIGLRTGEQSGIVVIDIDPRHGGDETWEQLVPEIGPVPETIEALTGGGGRHLAFAYPGRAVFNRSNIRPGIDVRGDGGYIVAPPSNHASGQDYRWRPGCSPSERAAAPLPTRLLDLILERPTPPPPPPPKPARSTEGTGRALAAMLTMRISDSSDGSKRLFAAACRCVEHDLTNNEAINVIRAYAMVRPFPKNWADDEILRRIRDAESRCTRGAGLKPTPRDSATTQARRTISRYRPFPVQMLPAPVADFVEEVSEAMQCDPAMVALPALSTLGTAIGTTRSASPKPGWCEIPMIWTAVIARSGAVKTPPFEAATQPLFDAQHEAFKRFKLEQEEYEAAEQQYERDLALWKKRRDSIAQPIKPKPPACVRYVVDDITLEALASILEANRRATLLAPDELDGWVQSFGQYKRGGQGADRNRWLRLHRKGVLIVDRKANRSVLYIRPASVCVTGTVQPGIFARSMSGDNMASGLTPRLLLAMPDVRRKTWTSRSASRRVLDAYRDTINSLLELRPAVESEHDFEPQILNLSADAQPLFADFYNRHGLLQYEASDDSEAAALAKLEGYALRLALVCELAENPEAAEIGPESMRRAISLVEWFAYEAKRVYGMLCESEEDCARRKLVERIADRGGSVSVREWQRARSLRAAEDADAELNDLVTAGYGEWKTPAQEGRGRPQAKVFHLTMPPDDDIETDKNPVTEPESVILSVSDVSEHQETVRGEDEWGEI